MSSYKTRGKCIACCPNSKMAVEIQAIDDFFGRHRYGYKCGSCGVVMTEDEYLPLNMRTIPIDDEELDESIDV